MPVILKYPDPLLLQRAEPVEFEAAAEIVLQLRSAASATDWGRTVGMAAPQLGISKRVFIALDEAFINPEVLARGKTKKLFLEGCYSLQPGKTDYRVVRATSVRMAWTNEQGERCEKWFSGFKAEVVQHEYDHLEGRLCGKT